MANGELKVVPAVFAILLKDKKVLLLRRANTSWMDGYYDLPAGHLEDQELLKNGAARELLEEAGIKVSTRNMKLVHIHQNHHNPSAPHYGYMFLVEKWRGQPKIMEPDKCDDMQFFDLDNLPKKIVPYTKYALDRLYKEDVSISYHAPGSIDMG